MGQDWASAASSAAGAVLGMATANWQDKRQIKQQEKLQKMQIQGQKEMGAYNQQLALDMWDKTNYDAQRAQMEKAGLNVGLMYGGSGSGGTTQGGAAGNVSGGQAAGGSGEIGMGMQAAMQVALLKAQKENIEADTENKKAEKPVKEQDVKTGIQTEEKTRHEARIKQLEALQKEATTEDERQIIREVLRREKADAGKAEAEEIVAATTISEKQKQERLETKAKEVGIRAAEAGILKTKADVQLAGKQMEKIAADIRVALTENQREWSKLTIAEREIYVKEAMAKNASAMTEFNTSTAAQAQQWMGILGSLVSAGAGAGGSRKIGF